MADNKTNHCNNFLFSPTDSDKKGKLIMNHLKKGLLQNVSGSIQLLKKVTNFFSALKKIFKKCKGIRHVRSSQADTVIKYNIYIF